MMIILTDIFQEIILIFSEKIFDNAVITISNWVGI